MQLAENADAVATCTVERELRLEPHLEIATDPDHTRINGAGRKKVVAEIVGDRRRHLELDDRDQVIDEIGKLQILYLRFQIRHAVLQRSTPGQHLRDKSALHQVERLRWNLITDLACNCERASHPAASGRSPKPLPK